MSATAFPESATTPTRPAVRARRLDVWILLAAVLPLLAGAALIAGLLRSETHALRRAGAIELAQAHFGASPAAARSGDIVALPNDWRAKQGSLRQGWYALALNLPEAPREAWALYLAGASLNAAAAVNGQTLADTGALTSPITRHFNRPLLLSIPSGLLRAGTNELLIEVATEPAGLGGLARVYAGPSAQLRPVQLAQDRWRVSAPKAVVILMWTMALMLLSLWVRRRRDSFYAWFALTVLAWSIANLDFCVADPPVSARAWNWFLFSSIGWLSFCYPVFIHRFVGRRLPRFERLLFVYALAYPVLLALLPSHEAMLVAHTQVFNNVHGAIGLYCCVRLFQACRRGDAHARLMFIVSMFGLVFAVHDTLSLGAVFIGHYTRFFYVGAPFIIGGYIWGVLGRYVEALHEAESLNREMEARVQEKTRQLQHSYEQLRQLELERLLLAERTRIMRDVHDGVGGQLLVMLSGVELGASTLDSIKDELRAAINDLRLVIDSLYPSEVTLHGLLYSFRERIAPALERVGLTAHWQIEELPADFALGPQQLLPLMRVVQEAVTNVLKHARARSVTIRLRATHPDGERGLELAVIDDGSGFSATSRAGHGISNMRHRAARLGGELQLHTDGTGTRVTLSLREPPARQVSVPEPTAA